MSITTPIPTTHDQLADLAPDKALAESVLGHPVEAALTFHRQGFAMSMFAEHLGWIVRFALLLWKRNRAAGLPEHFILAVDGDAVHVIRKRQRFMRASYVCGPEVATWRRSAIRFTRKPAVDGYLDNVSIVTGVEGEVVHCTVGRAPCVDAFLAFLGDPER